jgi:Rod binding domain-containing protein
MPLSSLSPASTLGRSALARAESAANEASAAPRISSEEREAREVFQQFVAGTFFQQMFKALRKTQGEAHFVNGGQAEKIFQGQFDQQVCDELAKRHGDEMCRSLVDPFLQQLRARLNQPQQAAATLTVNQVV